MSFDNVTTTMGSSQKREQDSSRWTESKAWYARLPYIYLVIFLCAVYIFSAHQAEKKVREIQRLQTDLTEMKWEYTSLNSNWIYSSTRSQIADKVAPMDLKWTSRAPVLIESPKRND